MYFILEEARTEEPVNVSPPKIRRTRRLISDDNMDKVADLADSQESDTKKGNCNFIMRITQKDNKKMG